VSCHGCSKRHHHHSTSAIFPKIVVSASLTLVLAHSDARRVDLAARRGRGKDAHGADRRGAGKRGRARLAAGKPHDRTDGPKQLQAQALVKVRRRARERQVAQRTLGLDALAAARNRWGGDEISINKGEKKKIVSRHAEKI
jgi:hypothetical protein